jgi:hypothetical protein
LVFLENKLKPPQFACPPRGIVLQSRGLVDQSLGNSARALVFEIRSCRCRRRSLRDGRHWAAGSRVDVGPQNEGRRFGTRGLGNLTDWRTGGESRYLRRRRDAHSRNRRCRWSAPFCAKMSPRPQRRRSTQQNASGLHNALFLHRTAQFHDRRHAPCEHSRPARRFIRVWVRHAI